MTIREAIAAADLQRPNSIAEDVKLGWINELEGIVQTRILLLSADALTAYVLDVSYSGTITVPDSATVVLASASGFRTGDVVRITATGNNGVSAGLLDVSSDGLTLSFAAGSFTAASATAGTATADRRDTELIVPAPYDRVYESYLMQRIDLALGDSDRFNNDRVWHNAVWDEFAKWYNRTHLPGTAETRGFFLTAYGLAVKHGFVGTEDDWLASLEGDIGPGTEMRYADGLLQWRPVGGDSWTTVLTLAQLQGSVVSDTLTAAQAARTAAETARDGAAAAKTAAETARAGAESAQTGAQAAQTAAEAARDAAASSRTASESAKTAAETAASAAAARSGDASSSAAAAQASAAAAAASAQGVQTAENNAAASAAAASASAQAAAGSASSASAGASSASTKAGEASASAQAAAASQADALVSKTAAASSASAAQSSAAAADTAKSAAQTAQTAAETAKTAAETASGTATTKATEAGNSASAAAAKALESQSWAAGGTNTRTGEDTNNAKYWSSVAQGAASGGVSTFNGRSGAVAPQTGDYTPEMVGADASGAAAAAVSSHNGAADAHAALFAAKLGTSGDGSNVTAAFTQATSRANIATGEKLSVILGKIMKWFADLGTAAFVGTSATPASGGTTVFTTGGAYTQLAAKQATTNSLTAETALADADYVPFYDDSASAHRKTLWSNIKAVLKTYFDTLYALATHTHTKSQITDFPTSMTPTAHAASHASGGADVITPAAIGAAELDTNSKVMPVQASAAIVSVSAAKTLALSDAGSFQLISSASAVTVTVPLNSAAAFPTGTEIELFRAGAGTVTVAFASGITVWCSSATYTIADQYTSVCLKKLGTDTWALQGNVG